MAFVELLLKAVVDTSVMLSSVCFTGRPPVLLPSSAPVSALTSVIGHFCCVKNLVKYKLFLLLNLFSSSPDRC